MKYPIYSIRDVKVGFGAPSIDINDQSRIRGFAYSVNQEGIMNFKPKDYDLYKVGEFDTDKGIIIPEKIPKLMASGVDVYEEKE